MIRLPNHNSEGGKANGNFFSFFHQETDIERRWLWESRKEPSRQHTFILLAYIYYIPGMVHELRAVLPSSTLYLRGLGANPRGLQ